MKKFVDLIFIIPLTAFILFSSTIFADEAPSNDKAIQAVATLLFQVNQEIHPTDQSDLEAPPLVWEPEEIENLWSQAISLEPSMILAQEEYWLGHNHQSFEAKQSLQLCADHLRSIWLMTNAISDEDQEETRHSLSLHQYSLNNLESNILLNKKIKKEIAPYLLPKDLPITPVVDQIFSSSRPTFNCNFLAQAGFHILHNQPRSYIVVASHPALPGMLFKLYYDTELRIKRNVPGWKWFVRRCAGAQLIRKVIAQKNIKFFTVPKKFIYVLPPSTIPLNIAEVDPKLAVLIVEDMNLVSKELNYVAWKNLITPETLNELYIIISRANGSSYRPDNIPFTHAGTFAFIDTEYPHRDPDFYSIRGYLSAEMCNYWDQLIKRGGP